jgi:hypothetical protein
LLLRVQGAVKALLFLAIPGAIKTLLRRYYFCSGVKALSFLAIPGTFMAPFFFVTVKAKKIF